MEISEFFVRKTRDDGTEFVSLRDDRPEWLHDAVHEAHGDEFPDDWVYATCSRVAFDIDDGMDDAHEIADSQTDVYNVSRVAWLAGNWQRASWVDQAREEGILIEGADLFEQLGIGQYMQIRHIAQTLLDAVEANQDEPEEDE